MFNREPLFYQVFVNLELQLADATIRNENGKFIQSKQVG